MSQTDVLRQLRQPLSGLCPVGQHPRAADIKGICVKTVGSKLKARHCRRSSRVFRHRLTSKLKASAVSCAKLPLSAQFFEAVGLEQRQNLVLT